MGDSVADQLNASCRCITEEPRLVEPELDQRTGAAPPPVS